MRTPDSSAIEDAAAEWLVRRHSGMTAAEEAELSAWCSSDSRHRAAFHKLERAWDALNGVRRAGQGELALAELARRRRRRLSRRLAGTAGLAAAIGLAFFLGHSRAPDAPATAIVHPDVHRLPDGSVVQLNAGAQFTWDFSGTERDVSLIRGEALFSVAHDAQHPFIVTAGGIRVRAVGTAFSVRLGSDTVEVLVTTGKVQVDSPGATTSVAVAAGQRTSVPLVGAVAPPPVAAVSPAKIEQALAWNSKRIEFTHATLSEVAEIFNRENSLKLDVEDPSVRNLQITGIYWANDPEGFIRLLCAGLDLKAERRGSVVVLVSP